MYMYKFLLNMYLMGRCDAEYIYKAVEKQRITNEEAESIIKSKVE